VEQALLPAHRTEYTWDSADNRLSKTESVSTNSTFLTTSTILYTTNALNQMLGYVEQIVDATSPSRSNSVTFAYDPNGARTGKTEIVDNISSFATNITAYTYDEDNRLIGASIGTNAQSLLPNAYFSYDYRSRRYYRSTPTGTNLCVFDGGLTIQEYDLSGSTRLPSINHAYPVHTPPPAILCKVRHFLPPDTPRVV